MKKYFSIALIIIALLGLYFCFPSVLNEVALWQREFNQLISAKLHQIKQTPTLSGLQLIAISFLYGVLHALGPGHGKFVIATYLSTHKSKLKTSVRLTFLSSLTQGFVAITSISIIVVSLQLSSSFFKVSQLLLERAAFIFMILLGGQWIYQGLKMRLKAKPLKDEEKTKPYIRRISIQRERNFNLKTEKNRWIANTCSADNACYCGHQHLPNVHQLQAQSWKSQLLVILSIGMRPCTGAIFVLFLAYMLDLYLWGIVAVIAMSLGTGIILSSFALFVQYARQTAIKMSTWYQLFNGVSSHAEIFFRLIMGTILIISALTLFYATLQPNSGGVLLFGR